MERIFTITSVGVLLRLGRNEEARAAYQRCIELTPKDPNSYDSLGLFYQWIGQQAEAESAHNHALAF
ncbi:MAG: tetratricopeptide repeat protein [Blastocatellia bacterium]